jgi:hypothetical protein
MGTLHDMLKNSSQERPPAASPQQQDAGVDLRGRYSKIAMPAVAAAARYHSGSGERNGKTAASKPAVTVPPRS